MGLEFTKVDIIFADNLRKAMSIKGINALELARRSGVGHPTIYDLVNKKRKNVNVNIASKLANGLGLSVGVLLTDQPFSKDDLYMVEELRKC